MPPIAVNHARLAAAAAREASSGYRGENNREQAGDGQGSQAPVADKDRLRGRGERAQPEQQPEHRVQAQRRRPVGDRTAQAAAFIGSRDRDVEVDVHADRVLDHEQHENGQAAASQPGQAGRGGACPQGGGFRLHAHLLSPQHAATLPVALLPITSSVA